MSNPTNRNGEIARHFVDVATTNSNSSIKSVWLILFTAGTFTALNGLNTTLVQLGWVSSSTPLKSPTEYPYASIALFVVYFLTFFRFYVGGIRIFDIRYTEIFKIVDKHLQAHEGEHAYKKNMLDYLKYQDQNIFKFEAIFLIFQTLIIVYLAYQIRSPIDFLKFYLILMIINSAWLTFSNLRFSPRISTMIVEIFPGAEESRSFQSMFPRKVGWLWVKNNLFAALVLAVCLLALSQKISFPENVGYWFTPQNILSLAIGITIINCLIDLHTARDFYFPRFSKLYETQALLQEEPAINPAVPSPDRAPSAPK